jgi:hypothetical protein
MPLRTRLLITGLATVAGLAASEVYVRHLDRRWPPLSQTDPLPFQVSSDPRIRLENRPGAKMVMRFFDRDAKLLREVTATINDLGFRGAPVEREKPAGVFRIVVIGDSQTFGIGVGESESWPAVMEGNLAPLVHGARLEVMNCAVAGYDAEQSAAALETQWLAYAPDLVLLGYFVNDPAVPGARSEPHLGPLRWLMPIVQPERRGFTGWLRRTSALVDFVCDGTYRRLRVREWALGAAALHVDGYEGWTRTRAAMERERDLCAGRGARFGVVLLPFLIPWKGALITTKPYAEVSNFCARSGIASVDLEPCFAGVALDGMLVHERDPHTGSRAHLLEGQAVAAWVLEQGLLPQSLR